MLLYVHLCATLSSKSARTQAFGSHEGAVSTLHDDSAAFFEGGTQNHGRRYYYKNRRMRAKQEKAGRFRCKLLNCPLPMPGAHLGAPAPARPASRALRPLAWLHIPKTGTSFANTVYHYGCNGTMLPVTATVAPNEVPIRPLQANWPIQQYCAGGFYQDLNVHHRVYYATQFGNVVTMMREPSALKESMYSFLVAWRMHRRAAGSWGLRNSSIADLVHSRRMAFGTFAQLPEVRGCLTKSILGLGCLTLDARLLNRANEEELFKRASWLLEHGFAFVGLTEEWDKSVCLFHAMYGKAPVAVQLSDPQHGGSHAHKTNHSEFITATELAQSARQRDSVPDGDTRTRRDELDYRLYAFAQTLFRRRQHQYACGGGHSNSYSEGGSGDGKNQEHASTGKSEGQGWARKWRWKSMFVASGHSQGVMFAGIPKSNEDG